MKKIILLAGFIAGIFFLNKVAAQKLGKRLLKTAKQTADQKAMQKTSDGVSYGIDKGIGGAKSIFKKKNKASKNENLEQEDTSDEMEAASVAGGMNTVKPDTITPFGVYTKFTFEPGNKILFFDDFEKDGIGDFPANWETNGSGEVVTNSTFPGKWLSFSKNAGYLPSAKALPENYTMEFDLATNGFSSNTGVNYISIVFANKKSYRMGALAGYAYLQIDMNKYGRLYIRNTGADKSPRINTRLDWKFNVDALVHFSVAVNKKRLRVWMEETKIVDIPSLLVGDMGRYVFFEGKAINNDRGNNVLLSNFKISEAKEDLRSQLLDKGRFSTTGIYFNTDKADIKPESYAIIKSVADYLKENPDVKIQIIGHTDAQGEDAYNLQLSEKRAQSVINALVQQFQIDEARLSAKGKGETEPVDDNATANGRANNRRVEFVKI